MTDKELTESLIKSFDVLLESVRFSSRLMMGYELMAKTKNRKKATHSLFKSNHEAQIKKEIEAVVAKSFAKELRGKDKDFAERVVSEWTDVISKQILAEIKKTGSISTIQSDALIAMQGVSEDNKMPYTVALILETAILNSYEKVLGKRLTDFISKFPKEFTNEFSKDRKFLTPFKMHITEAVSVICVQVICAMAILNDDASFKRHLEQFLDKTILRMLENGNLTDEFVSTLRQTMLDYWK